MIDFAKFEEKQNELLNASNEKKKAFIQKFSEASKEEYATIFDGWNLPSVDDFIPPAEPWGEKEFPAPPWSACGRLVKSLKAIPANKLWHPPLWFAIHVKCVESGFLKRSFFAFHKASQPNGEREIKAILKSTDDEKIDICLRDILRHAGGIVVRYNRTVYLDCPTSVMYWRYHMVQETKKHSLAKDISEEEIYQCLLESAVWRQLAEAATTRKTIIGESHIRAAFIVFMLNKIQELKRTESEEDKAKRVKRIINRVADLNQRRHLGFLEPRKIVKIFEKDEKIKNV
ncbi:MAG: hypothetical protein ISN26_06970 [Betaproteobacteria bacterium AqS2]|uniref:Uncharacterized protein n=1 Tax=Candidatus Amphirhobacter heronislandensis TaxID=1732024 RepID=A0A930UFT6_9GAMM|nr:hypothetical protein [Betaproteobacteria bacterium AqS2]